MMSLVHLVCPWSSVYVLGPPLCLDPVPCMSLVQCVCPWSTFYALIQCLVCPWSILYVLGPSCIVCPWSSALYVLGPPCVSILVWESKCLGIQGTK